MGSLGAACWCRGIACRARIHLRKQRVDDCGGQAQGVPRAHLQRGMHQRSHKSLRELQRASAQAEKVLMRTSFELPVRCLRNNTTEASTYMNNLRALNMAADANNNNCSSLQKRADLKRENAQTQNKLRQT